jgi:hypothetical protein
MENERMRGDMIRDQRFDSGEIVLDNNMFINCIFDKKCTFRCDSAPPIVYHCAIVLPNGQYIDAKSGFERKIGVPIIGASRNATSYESFIVCLKSGVINELSYRNDNPEHDRLTATVIYDLFVDGRWDLDLRSQVRQFGANYETDPIMLSTPDPGRYKGPFPVDEFDDAVIRFFRDNVGEQAKLLNLDGNFELADIGFTSPVSLAIVLPIRKSDEPCGGWLLDGIPRWRKPHERPSAMTPLGEAGGPASQPEPSAESLKRND